VRQSEVTREDPTDLFSKAPDGSFVIASPRGAGVQVLSGYLLYDGSHYISQREYATPFGPLTLLEFSADLASQEQQLKGTTIAPSFHGTTANGSQWFVFDVNGRRHIHVVFARTAIETDVPAGTPISAIAQAVATIQ
jgi:hypothetical protein